MKSIFAVLLFLIITTSYNIHTSSGEIKLQAQTVEASVQEGDLLQDFNDQVRFTQRIVPNRSYNVRALVHIVQNALEEYQREVEPVMLPCKELKKVLLRSLLREHPALLAAVLVQ